MPNLIYFPWFRHLSGYQFRDPSSDEFEDTPYADEARFPFIRPLDYLAGVVRYWPLEEHPALFATFASLEPTPESFIGFANTYGALERPLVDEFGPENREDERPDEWGSPLGLWVNAQNAFSELFRLMTDSQHSGDFKAFVRAMNSRLSIRLNVRMVNYPGVSQPSLALVPANLIEAMSLQMAQAVTTELKLRTCVNCGKWFPYGKGGKTKRKSASYCSNRCKTAFHRKRKENQHGNN